MKKNNQVALIVAFVLILFLPAIAQTTAENNLADVIAGTRPAVVYITVYDRDGDRSGTGTGFFIQSNGTFVTTRHVLVGGTRAEIQTFDGDTYNITTIMNEDRDADLLIGRVEATGKTFRTLRPARTTPRAGENVIVIGNPMGLEFSVSTGIVSAVRELNGEMNVIQITAPVSPGSSGSPVLNSRGEVIGVASFQLIRGQNLNFAIPVERITGMRAGTPRNFRDWAAGRAQTGEESPESLYTAGVERINEEDYQGAANYFIKAIQKDPSYAEAYYKLGYAYARMEQYDKALEALANSLKHRPNDENVYFNMGILYARMKRYTEAVNAYKKSISINERYVKAYYNLGLIYAETNQKKEAIAMLKKTVELKSDHAGAYFNLGLMYADAGKIDEAITAFREAIKIEPDDSESHYRLGAALYKKGDHAGALQEYKILKSQDPEMAAKLFREIYQ